MTGIIDALYKRILLAAHPVGSIYQSMVSTSPEEFFGGTWDAIEEGRTLIQCGPNYPAGSTGGEATHILTKPEMPIHRHIVPVDGEGQHVTTGYEARAAEWLGPNSTTNAAETSETGGSQPHNNLPPYLAIYMWQRTA